MSWLARGKPPIAANSLHRNERPGRAMSGRERLQRQRCGRSTVEVNHAPLVRDNFVRREVAARRVAKQKEKKSAGHTCEQHEFEAIGVGNDR